jgi:hypothetical protein
MNRSAQAPALRSRFERFAKCHASFKSRLPDSDDFFKNAALHHRRPLELALACLIEAPGIAALATDYAAHAHILYEWEGMSEAPLVEAAYAETYITEHPKSPLLPYLYLWVAEGARYAFEMLDGEKNQEGMTTQAARYRTFIARARSADPMVELVANDFDGLSFVYTNIGKHPRDYRSAAEVTQSRTETLDSRIGPAVASKYRGIRDAKDWLNPYLAVCPRGVDLTVASVKHKSLVSIPDLRAALIKLPMDAWPYGRIVGLQECSIGTPGDEQARRQRLGAVEDVLKALGLQVSRWPPEPA